LKQLLTAFYLVLLAQWSLADQRAGRAALEKAIDAFNQGKIEQAEKLVDTAARADSK
jgi:hypothetical protein